MTNWVPLRHLTSSLGRGTAPTYVDDGPVRIVNQAANQAGGLDWSRTKFHDFSGNASTLRGHLKFGDVLVNSTGNGTLGRVGWFENAPDSRPCVADGHVTKVRFDPARMNKRFGYYYLSSDSFQKFMFETLVAGSTNQIELNGERMQGALAPCPPLDEQRRIADFLDVETDRIDRLLDLRRRTRAAATMRYQAIVDTRLDDIDSQFGTIPFRRVVETIEQGVSPECESAEAGPDQWAVLKLSSIKNGLFDANQCKPLPTNLAPAVRYEVDVGDLLVTRANTPELVGDSAVADSSGKRRLLPDLIYRVSLTDRMDARFADFVIRGSRIRGLVRATARGTSQSMVKLRGEDIRQWPTPCPPLHIQHEVVRSLQRAAEWRQSVQANIDQQCGRLAERRHALVTAAVTGQLDVATAGRAS